MLWSLSYNTYDTITVCSLGSLVICSVAGAAIFMGIAQGGGWKYHKQVRQENTLQILVCPVIFLPAKQSANYV